MSSGDDPCPQTCMQLHTVNGTHKYLTAGDAVLWEVNLADRPALCMTLAYAGSPKPWPGPLMLMSQRG
jgi:hypothetical protein